MNKLLNISDLPRVYDVPIINYFNSKVYCKGMFRNPTDEETRGITSDKPLVAVFDPAEKHGWKVYFYSIDEVIDMIGKSREI